MLIMLLVFFGCAAVQAEMSSSNYKIPSLTISSGGEDEMSSSNYKIQDIKGQGVIGSSSSANYEAELGGIYGLGVPVVVIEGVPFGTVPLNIERSGLNIRISWDSAIHNPQIFVRTGNGSGQYVNDGDATVWVDITGPSIADEFDLTHTGENYILHRSQVGDVSTRPEVYYKGLQSGVSPTAINPDFPSGTVTNLAAAWAVGKLDINIGAGMNVITVPFLRADDGIADVLNTDLLSDSDSLYFKPLSDSPNTEKATLDSGVWKDDSGSPSVIQIGPDYGYWIEAGGSKTLTVWGEVVRADSRPILVKDGGILVIGCVYPKQTLFADAGLDAAGGAADGDAVYYKPLADSPNTQKVIFDGTNWSDPVEDRTFTLPFGYWYERKSDVGDLNFNHLRPWEY